MLGSMTAPPGETPLEASGRPLSRSRVATWMALAVLPLALIGMLGITVPAASAAEPQVCPNAKYRTGPSLFLPDCRAYELVTPPLKANELAVWNASLNPTQVSADGSKILYLTATGPTATSAFGGIPNWEVATRDDKGGWQVEGAIAPPKGPWADPITGVPNWMITTPQLDRFFFYASVIYDPANQPFSSTGDSRQNGGVFLADKNTAIWASRPTALSPLPVQGEDSTGDNFVPSGGAADLSTVFFTSAGILTPEDEASGRGAYESWAAYKFKDGTLTNAGVLPDGTISRGGSIDAAREGSLGTQPSAGDVERSRLNPVSENGRSFLFVSPDPQRAAADPSLPKPQLYMAIEGEDTVLVSTTTGASDPVVGTDGVAPVTRVNHTVSKPGYAVATPDHSVVLFATKDVLLEEAEGTDPGVVKHYRYEKEDGSLVYLPELDGEGRAIELHPSGDALLYVTAGGSLRLWRAGAPTAVISEGTSISTIRSARLSDNAEVVLLNSAVALRGESDHAGPYGGASPRTHVYRYDAPSDSLDCVSCLPGTPLPGSATFTLWGPAHAMYSTSTSIRSYWSTRGMSDDGSRVFFTSGSALLDEDRNTVNDVYQWHDGELSLISSGASGSRGERLYDTNADGSTVFISSAEQLVAADRDEYFDIYAVRVGGGFDPPQPPTSDSGCVGDVCQGSAERGPALMPVLSVDFSGAGNVHPESAQRVAVMRARATRGAVARLRVLVPGAGRIVLRGGAVRGSARKVGKAGAYNLRVALKPRARRKLNRRGAIDVAVRVTFRSPDGVVSRRVRVAFKQPKVKRSNRSAATRKGR